MTSWREEELQVNSRLSEEEERGRKCADMNSNRTKGIRIVFPINVKFRASGKQPTWDC